MIGAGIILLLSLPQITAWACGNDGQCSCTSTDYVLCRDAHSAPFFSADRRNNKMLIIKTSGKFDMTSLRNTVGFASVLVVGTSSDQCSEMTLGFPWVRCMTTENTTPMMKIEATSGLESDTVHVDTTAAHGEHSQPLLDSSKTPGYDVGMIVWTSLSTIFGGITTCCILVSLVNLHARINSHARANDPALFAVAGCLKCMALLLYSVHLIAKCCNCTWGDMHTMDRGPPQATTPFQV
jgi:hypothetical protein